MRRPYRRLDPLPRPAGGICRRARPGPRPLARPHRRRVIALKGKPMLIVDAQIHLWEKGTPSAHHRQEPYSAEEAIAGMDEAGVDRALVHPVLWDPDSNELAIEAVGKYPGRFAIMGW